MSRRRKELVVEPGGILARCSEEEALAFGTRWLAAFGGADSDGIDAKAYRWYVFSGGRYPCTAGDQALADYERVEAVAFVVLSNDFRAAVTTAQPPLRCSWSDYLVFPPNLAWTLARTHEEGWLGPYFAKHARYEALNAENAAAVRKQREAALARARCWAPP